MNTLLAGKISYLNNEIPTKVVSYQLAFTIWFRTRK